CVIRSPRSRARFDRLANEESASAFSLLRRSVWKSPIALVNVDVMALSLEVSDWSIDASAALFTLSWLPLPPEMSCCSASIALVFTLRFARIDLSSEFRRVRSSIASVRALLFAVLRARASAFLRSAAYGSFPCFGAGLGWGLGPGVGVGVGVGATGMRGGAGGFGRPGRFRSSSGNFKAIWASYRP